jgi:hypothetical protein
MGDFFSKVVHLAHQNASLRPHLLPLLKSSAGVPHWMIRNPGNPFREDIGEILSLLREGGSSEELLGHLKLRLRALQRSLLGYQGWAQQKLELVDKILRVVEDWDSSMPLNRRPDYQETYTKVKALSS